MVFNLPNMLTIFRIVLVPPLVACFFFDGAAWRWIACAIFVVASLTDYLDGVLARWTAQQSSFGAFLDPIADKLIVATALFMMAAFKQIEGWTLLPALVILCREILVSGLREFLGTIRVTLPVSSLAKWKTTLQMVAIALLLVGAAAPTAGTAGIALIWLAAALTLVTGWSYLRAGLAHMRTDAPDTEIPQER